MDILAQCKICVYVLNKPAWIIDISFTSMISVGATNSTTRTNDNSNRGKERTGVKGFAQKIFQTDNTLE